MWRNTNIQLSLLYLVAVVLIGLSCKVDASVKESVSFLPFGAKIRSDERVQNRSFILQANSALGLRGGSDSEENEYEEEYDDEEACVEESSSDLVGTAISTSRTGVTFVGSILTKIVSHSISAIRRAINAGFEGDMSDDSEDEGLLSRILNTSLRMVKAVFDFEGSIGSESEDKLEEDFQEEPDVDSGESDFGSFLSKAYGVPDGRGEDGPVILGGSLASALDAAREQARMLVVFLPAQKPSKGKNTNDQSAVESILNSEVGQAANKRARYKGGDTGSFVFWSASFGSRESTAATKSLKGKLLYQKGRKRPILAVIFPQLVRFLLLAVARNG